MAAQNIVENTNSEKERSLFTYFRLFEGSFYTELKNSVKEFFCHNYEIRFMSITTGDNILFYGDEYFVDKIPFDKQNTVKIRISSDLISSLLDNTLGISENKFSLSRLTELEALLIKDYTGYLYEKISGFFVDGEAGKKYAKHKQEYTFTFYVRSDKIHAGKILITVPGFILKDFEPAEIQDRFSLEDFPSSQVIVKVAAGAAKITLSDLKALEEGDIIVLDESNINTMAIILNKTTVPFKIKPDPELIVGINNDGGIGEMEEDTEIKTPGMWDSLPVDVIAEFDNVKLTLGELKQVSEGLVIDVGSVYENQIKLRVENKTIATGELVILNDRYGVRITDVVKAKEQSNNEAGAKRSEPAETPKQQAKAEKQQHDKQQGQKQAPQKPMPQKPGAQKPMPQKPADKKVQQQPKGGGNVSDEDEDFDYGDFEIDDESI